MTLVLEVPAGWRETGRGRWSAGGAEILAGPIMDVPADVDAALAELLTWQAAGPVRIVADELGVSGRGWPTRTVVARAGDETRTVVLFALLDRAAVVLVRGEASTEVLAVIGGARPDWGGGGETLSHVFAGFLAAAPARAPELDFWID